MKLEKLIKEYTEKADRYQYDINLYTEKIAEIRKNRLYGTAAQYIYDTERFSESRKIIEAKRMLLVQIIKDLEDCLQTEVGNRCRAEGIVANVIIQEIEQT